MKIQNKEEFEAAQIELKSLFWAENDPNGRYDELLNALHDYVAEQNNRKEALDELTRYSQELGMYDELPERIVLSKRDFSMFQKMLRNPQPPTWHLVEIMSGRKVSWLTKTWLWIKLAWWKINF